MITIKLDWGKVKLRFRAFVHDCLLMQNDWCEGCKYSYQDQYGNMCKHPRRHEQIRIRNRATFRTHCNLWEAERNRTNKEGNDASFDNTKKRKGGKC